MEASTHDPNGIYLSKCHCACGAGHAQDLGTGLDSVPGRAGYLRVDSVHQGDLDKVKGVYHINVVDEVTQYEFVGTVERISERYLIPVLEGLLGAFPFQIRGFHSDHGSEYANYQVAALLEKLRVEEFTKSRVRRTNDNALVESKNGTVIRKQLGYGPIAGRHAERLDTFNRKVLSPYLNYHRPCYFPSEETDAKGKVHKRYRHADLMTPYEKLKSLPGAAAWLRPGIDFAGLDAEANSQSDNGAVGRGPAWGRQPTGPASSYWRGRCQGQETVGNSATTGHAGGD